MKINKQIKRVVSIVLEKFQTNHIWIVEAVAADGSTAHISNHRTPEGALRAHDKAWKDYFRPGSRSLMVSAIQYESIRNKFNVSGSLRGDWARVLPVGEKDIFEEDLGITDSDLQTALILEGVGPRIRVERVYL